MVFPYGCRAGMVQACTNRQNKNNNKERKKDMTNEMNAQLRDLFISIREGDNQLVYLSDSIKAVLTKAKESGVTREAAMKSLKKWNENTDDGAPIRSQSILDRWMRDAGFTSTNKDGTKRQPRTGVVKSSAKDKAVAKIKALMKQHGLTVSDLA